MPPKIVKLIKLQIPAGKANPAPPVGPALGQCGLNIQTFCKEFNDRTSAMGDSVLPIVITVYENKTYTFVVKKPPAGELIKKKLNLKKGSATPNKDKVGTLTKKQLQEIAEEKMEDLNANDIEAAMNIIAGTARNMGVKVE